MSFDRYIELLQQLITMTDPDNEDQVLYAKNILINLLELAQSSKMVDSITYRTMVSGRDSFTNLLRSKKDFAGKRGDIAGNQAKRRRLAMILRPGC